MTQKGVRYIKMFSFFILSKTILNGTGFKYSLHKSTETYTTLKILINSIMAFNSCTQFPRNSQSTLL